MKPLINRCALALAMLAVLSRSQTFPTPQYLALQQIPIINADLWSDRPQIFTANYAFEGIKGVINGTVEQFARAAGGTWNTVPERCANVTAVVTTVSDPAAIALSWGWPVSNNGDAMPVVFSWPVLHTTVNATDFELTLNTGAKVNPQVASSMPNYEPNERHVVVIFGQFGNRLDPSDPAAVYVTQVRIVDDGTPLMLVGPQGPVSAVGLTYDATCCPPYGRSAVGPRLVAAKLSTICDDGLTGEAPAAIAPDILPNDCRSMYGEAAQWRLRMYTSGGFSPGGVRSMYPTEYSRYFRLHVRLPNRKVLLVNESLVAYPVLDQGGEEEEEGGGDKERGALVVLGLADLGHRQDAYDECYQTDQDNYIDICLSGSWRAVSRIFAVEMPAGNFTADPAGRYAGLYNPGGPGNSPTCGVTYTKPSGYRLQPVALALDDPRTVSWPAPPRPPRKCTRRG